MSPLKLCTCFSISVLKFYSFRNSSSTNKRKLLVSGGGGGGGGPGLQFDTLILGLKAFVGGTQFY